MSPVPFIPIVLAAADLTGNHTIDGADLAFLLSAWHTSAGDLNGDGTTDGTDLAQLLTVFGFAWVTADKGDGGIWMSREAHWTESPWTGYRRLADGVYSCDERID